MLTLILKLLALACVATVLPCASVLAQPPGVVPIHGDTSKQPVPAARLARLAKGVNLSHWYWLPDEPGPEARRAFLSDADIAALKGAGILHVRLPIDPDLLFDQQGMIVRPEFRDALLADIARINAAGIAVVFDIHPHGGTPFGGPWLKVEPESGRIDLLLYLWSELAGQLASTDPEMVIIEIVNEPSGIKDATLWWRAQDRLLKVVRHGLPSHTIVLTGDEWGGIVGLERLTPHEDTNVVYSFHFYEPMIFTHQGATWGWEGWKQVRGLEYPTNAENVNLVADAMLKGGEADEMAKQGSGAVRDFGTQAWNKARLAKEIARAKAWGQKHGVTIWCGEFGAYKQFAPRASRLAWIRDAREALEEAGIGWSMWDYAGGFSLTSGKPGARELDADVVAALGLGANKSDKAQADPEKTKAR